MQSNYTENLEFFKWLFSKENITLESTIDLILCHDYEDSNIYYPKEFGNLFRSSPMQRISRILQLGKFIENDKYTYHTRFEHSMGVYNNKKNIILTLYKDPKFKQYIEKNNLKNFLIAEIIKSMGHDIGHLPLSHVLEISVIHKREFHEVMGKRILLENAEIRRILDAISPSLYNALDKTLSSGSIFGFDLIDEGNYDIDRFDYLNRDLLYRGKYTSLKFEPFTLTKIEDSSNNKKIIPVFDIKSVPAIEEFLNLRLKAYRESYMHPITQILDSSVAIAINELIRENSPYAYDLQQFLLTLKENTDASQIDLDKYLTWDDLKLYSQLLDVAEFSENTTLSQLATFVLPSLVPFMNILYTMLNLKNTKLEDLKPSDRELVSRIHRIIHSNTKFAADMRNTNFFNQIVKYTLNQKQISNLQKDCSVNKTIFFNTQSLSGYKPSEPIYVKNTDGKIYTIDNLPNRDFAVSSKKEELSVVFILTPLLEDKNIDISSTLGEQIHPSIYFDQKRTINMNPLKVENQMLSYFDGK